MHCILENIPYQIKIEGMGTNDEILDENGSKYLISIQFFAHIEIDFRNWYESIFWIFFISAIVKTTLKSDGYIHRSKVEELMGIISVKLNLPCTSIWHSEDGDGICDLKEFLLNIATSSPEEVILILKEASFLEQLNDQCRKSDVFFSSENVFETLTDPETQDIKGMPVFQKVYFLK